MNQKKIFLPGLNGIRAFAALSVLFSHSILALKSFNINYAVFGLTADGSPKGYKLAEHGVTIFFVLSGFLITYLLQLEIKKTRQINIKKFYIRRVLRIWPLYYLYFFIVCIVIYYLKDFTNFKTGFYYIFFAANIPFIGSFGMPLLHHFWSIAVEEQFYLFWPLIMKFKKNLKIYLIVFILIYNIIRVGVWYFYPFTKISTFLMVNRFDCMIIGAIGSILYLERNVVFCKIFCNKILQYVVIIFFILLILNIYHFNTIIDTFIVAISALVLIIGQINLKARVVNLNKNILDYLGKLSYGIYVYHPLIIYLLSFFISDLNFNIYIKIFIVIASILIITVLVSHISYNFFEKKFIKLKDNFAVIKSSNSKFIEKN